MYLLAEDELGLGEHFACLDPLVPGVTNVCLNNTSALCEPRTAVGTTTDFTRSHDVATFGAHGTDRARRRHDY